MSDGRAAMVPSLLFDGIVASEHGSCEAGSRSPGSDRHHALGEVGEIVH